MTKPGVTIAVQPSVPRWQLPRIVQSDRWIGGVASAIARELGVESIVVRGSFLLLSLAGGWGLALYALAWLVLAVAQPSQASPYVPQPKAATSFHRHLAIAMVVLGLLLVLRNGLFFFGGIVWPVAFVVTGFLVAWTRHRNEDGVSAVVRILAGVVVGVGGMIAFLTLSSTARVLDALLMLVVALAVVAGIGLVAAPSLARIGQDLDSERQKRVRADERARVAAHLHDSVLQTLTLIQQNATDPDRTMQLARQQERQLRSWLYGRDEMSLKPGTVHLRTVLSDMAGEVDADHGVPINVVSVGDGGDLSGEILDPLVAATREAAVNAARHSGAKRIDVFAERTASKVEIFVRDKGVGFDPDTLPEDRRGVAESIVARMERAGGSAEVRSTPGEGTEVRLTLPLVAERAATERTGPE